VLFGILSRAAVLMGSGVVTGAAVVLFVAWLWGEDIAPLVLWLAVTAAVMLATGLLASLVPARRALSISPTDALKEV
jgi:ABC-type antimicrobial peptide transport system permease subunit